MPEGFDVVVYEGSATTAPREVTVIGAQDAAAHDEQMIILVMVETSPASGDTAPEYEPVGGSPIPGVVVTIDDDEPVGGL